MNQMTRKSAHKWRWQCLGALLIPLFLSACTSSPRSIRWIDPDFARGRIPVSHLELLPMSVDFQIDGVGAATWKELQKHRRKFATTLENEIRRSFGKNQYTLLRGRMSRDRLYHLLERIQETARAGNASGHSVGVNPVLVAGGIPGTDAVLVVEGFANLTTTGKRAAQIAAVTLMILVVVLIIAAVIIYATTAKGSKKGKSKKIRGKKSGKRRYVRRSRKTRYKRRDSRVYRRRYFRRRSHRAYRRRSTRRYYRGFYRTRRGRVRRYRVLHFRSHLPPTMFLYYSPYHSDNSRHSRSIKQKQGFFSGSFLDLSVSMVEKGTGLLLWHSYRRWKVDPSSPNQIRQTVRKLMDRIPMGRKAKPFPTPTAIPKSTPIPEEVRLHPGQPNPKGIPSPIPSPTDVPTKVPELSKP